MLESRVDTEAALDALSFVSAGSVWIRSGSRMSACLTELWRLETGSLFRVAVASSGDSVLVRVSLFFVSSLDLSLDASID